MARSWYSYNGTGATNQPSSYTLVTSDPTCVEGTRLCAIYAINGGANPSTISARIQAYISNLFVTGVPQPVLPVGAKKYVYGKF